jgi:hypothetical protein
MSGVTVINFDHQIIKENMKNTLNNCKFFKEIMKNKFLILIFILIILHFPLIAKGQSKEQLENIKLEKEIQLLDQQIKNTTS